MEREISFRPSRYQPSQPLSQKALSPAIGQILPLTPNDFKKILEYVDVIDHEVILALIVLYETAMRRGEVIKLRKEGVRFDSPAHIRISGTEHKNRNPRS